MHFPCQGVASAPGKVEQSARREGPRRLVGFAAGQLSIKEVPPVMLLASGSAFHLERRCFQAASGGGQRKQGWRLRERVYENTVCSFKVPY